MATFNIGFAETVALDQYGKPIPVQTVPPEPGMEPIDLTFTTTPATTTAVFPVRAKWLRLQTSNRCRFYVDTGTPTFPGGFGYTMEAGQTEMFGLNPNIKADEMKLIVQEI